MATIIAPPIPEEITESSSSIVEPESGTGYPAPGYIFEPKFPDATGVTSFQSESEFGQYGSGNIILSFWDNPRVGNNLPDSLVDRLRELANLPADWDGYGAPAISPKVFTKTAMALKEGLSVAGKNVPLPFIAPANNGMLVVEWSAPDGKELILDIPPDDPISFLLIELDEEGKETETEGVIGEQLTIREVIRQFLEK